ncbi:hypothetical protein [Streptomyces subrutilus]|uniref:hypothetical protein n=1 Tax=Streptomyces subrutilus TaxID=36818 RepID=UPI0016780D89|nr:hypothetical protein [Streptomyces subrutilus]
MNGALCPEAIDAVVLLRQMRQVGHLLQRLTRPGPEPDEIARMIRAAIHYDLYTRTQPLTIPQLAGDLGADPAATALAVEELVVSGVLIKDGTLYRLCGDGPVPTAHDRILMRLHSQIAAKVHPPYHPLPIEQLARTLGTSEWHMPLYFGHLRRAGLVWHTDDGWILLQGANRRVRRPPRLTAPPPPPVPFTGREIAEAAAALNHAKGPASVPVYRGDRSWSRLRAMAVQVLATLPAATDEDGRLAVRTLTELSTALAPHEPWARTWHTACLATAIDDALTLLPHTGTPPEGTPQ